MLTVKLPDLLETRLESAARAVGRSKEEIVLAAISERLLDIEDALIARERIDDSDAEWLSLEEAAEFGGKDLSQPQQ